MIHAGLPGSVPALTINKTVTAVDLDIVAPFLVDAAGDVIYYSILVSNTGNQTLTDVTVSDPLLGALSCTWPGTAGSLGVGQSVTCTGSYIVTQADIDNNGGGDGDIDNTATVSSATSDPSAGNNSATRIPMMAMTMTTSIRVNAGLRPGEKPRAGRGVLAPPGQRGRLSRTVELFVHHVVDGPRALVALLLAP